jgi:hypothetical protein
MAMRGSRTTRFNYSDVESKAGLAADDGFGGPNNQLISANRLCAASADNNDSNPGRF